MRVKVIGKITGKEEMLELNSESGEAAAELIRNLPGTNIQKMVAQAVYWLIQLKKEKKIDDAAFTVMFALFQDMGHELKLPQEELVVLMNGLALAARIAAGAPEVKGQMDRMEAHEKEAK